MNHIKASLGLFGTVLVGLAFASAANAASSTGDLGGKDGGHAVELSSGGKDGGHAVELSSGGKDGGHAVELSSGGKDAG